MISLLKRIFPVVSSFGLIVSASAQITYSNHIRQWQTPSGVNWDATSTVTQTGTQLSALAINPGGARFDLWTIRTVPTPAIEYLLATTYVGTYIPVATVVIDTEDPYGKNLTVTGPVPANSPGMRRRTRADRGFTVYVTVEGILSGATDPVTSKSLKLLRHVQSYGLTGDGSGIDRTQATLQTQSFISVNGTQTLPFGANAIPGANRALVRGEERFSVFSLADSLVPETQIASDYIQVWPVASGSFTGIASGQVIKSSMPALSYNYTNIYPGSNMYLQAYQGNAALGTTGIVVPGSVKTCPSDSAPVNASDSWDTYDRTGIFTDGVWTIELIDSTVFGDRRLQFVTFTVDRSIKVNGSITTIE